MNIYIGNLALSTTEDTLKSLFVEFGDIESVKVIKDGRQLRSRPGHQGVKWQPLRR